jgi:hypothetical protein
VWVRRKEEKKKEKRKRNGAVKGVRGQSYIQEWDAASAAVFGCFYWRWRLFLLVDRGGGSERRAKGGWSRWYGGAYGCVLGLMGTTVSDESTIV